MRQSLNSAQNKEKKKQNNLKNNRKKIQGDDTVMDLLKETYHCPLIRMQNIYKPCPWLCKEYS